MSRDVDVDRLIGDETRPEGSGRVGARRDGALGRAQFADDSGGSEDVFDSCALAEPAGETREPPGRKQAGEAPALLVADPRRVLARGQGEHGPGVSRAQAAATSAWYSLALTDARSRDEPSAADLLAVEVAVREQQPHTRWVHLKHLRRFGNGQDIKVLHR